MSAAIEALRQFATDAWPRPWRNGFALAIWIVAFLASSYAFTSLEPQTGVVLEVQGEHLVVLDVAPWSPAHPQLDPGMIVVNVDGMPIVSGPEQVAKPEPEFLYQM